MSSAFELPFDFTYGYATSPKPVCLPFAPFNSGTWTFTYTPSSHMVTLGCQDTNSTLTVTSVSLWTRCKTVAGRDRSADSGISKAKFPPRPCWSLSCTVAGDGYSQNRPACQAVLLVTVEQSSPASEPFTELKAEVKQVASRNTSE